MPTRYLIDTYGCQMNEYDSALIASMLEKNGCESISHRLFDGMRHDIIFEKNNAVVWKDIAKTLFSWVDRYNDSHEVIQTE